MALQDKSIPRTGMQNTILNLEKKYYAKLENIFLSSEFQNDLLLIEKEIRENYPKFKDTWELKNKIKVPAERVIRHHIYMQLSDEIRGIYPSPISSDFGVKMDDCVLCVDAKTLDTVGNSGDIKATAAEPNQVSFDNSRHKYIPTLSNLESIDHYSRLPVLTFIIKIIYTDNNYSFTLARGNHPSLVLTCLPNGELSNLFEKDIIQNFKTYDYYSEKDNECFAPHPIPKGYNTKAQKDDYVRTYCMQEKGFVPIEIELDHGSKQAYFDSVNRCYWWLTSLRNQAVIMAVKNGSSMRFSNDTLRRRYDSSDHPWTGYKEFQLPDPLP